MDVIPYPGYIIVYRQHMESHSQGGVWVPRQDQEETCVATVVHPGTTNWKMGQHLIVADHCGTDFWWDDGDMEFTILNQDTEVLAEVVS